MILEFLQIEGRLAYSQFPPMSRLWMKDLYKVVSMCVYYYTSLGLCNFFSQTYWYYLSSTNCRDWSLRLNVSVTLLVAERRDELLDPTALSPECAHSVWPRFVAALRSCWTWSAAHNRLRSDIKVSRNCRDMDAYSTICMKSMIKPELSIQVTKHLGINNPWLAGQRGWQFCNKILNIF